MLDFVTTLHLEESEKLVQTRVEHYLDLQAYKAKRDRKNEVYYERGSAMGNYFSMGPRGWHVFAYVTLYPINDQTVSMDVKLKVDTQGQYVLERERQYWETEFDVMTSYLQTGKSKKEDILGDLGRHNHLQNIRLNLYLTVGFFGILTLVLVGAIFLGISVLGTHPCTCR